MVINSLYLRRILALYAAAMLTVIIILELTQFAGAIARGYTTDDNGLQTGMVAALSIEGSSTVERATQDNSARTVGVVTTYDASSVTVASEDSKVLVESEGEVEAYVSDLRGDVKQGDLLIISPLRGVLMKASESSTGRIIGIAAANISEDSEGASYTVEDDGKQKETKIYKIKVNLSSKGSANTSAASDSALSRLGEAIVGKNVGEIRVLIALILFIIVLITEGGIIYGAVSSAIVALGRNPLARSVIKKEMVQVTIVAILVLIIGVGAVYGVLWI